MWSRVGRVYRVHAVLEEARERAQEPSRNSRYFILPLEKSRPAKSYSRPLFFKGVYNLALWQWRRAAVDDQISTLKIKDAGSLE